MPWYFSGEKIGFSFNGAGTTVSLWGKKVNLTHLKPYTANKLIGIIALNIRAKTIKLREQNIIKNCDIRLGKNFLNRAKKPESIYEKYIQWT